MTGAVPDEADEADEEQAVAILVEAGISGGGGCGCVGVGVGW